MKLSNFILSVGAVTILSWLAWLAIVFFVNPDTAGLMGITVFYSALFLALYGTFTLAGVVVRIIIRKWHQEQVIVFRYMAPSLRQAIWFTLLVEISLWLLAGRLFTWWSVAILILGFIALEGFYLTKSIDNTANQV